MLLPMIVMMLYGVIGGMMVMIILHGREPDIRPALLTLCGIYVFWVLASILIMTAGSDEVRWVIYRFSAVGWAFYPPTFLWLCLLLTKTGTERFRMIVMAILGSFGFTLFVINMIWPQAFIHGFTPMPYGWAVISSHMTPVYLILLLFIGVCASGCLFLLLRATRTASSRDELRRDLLLMSGALLTAVFSGGSSISIPGNDLGNPSLAPVYSLPWFLALFVVSLRWGFAPVDTQVSVSEILSRMRELLIVTDMEGTVLHLNAHARSVLGFWARDARRISISQVIPDLLMPKGDIALEQTVAIRKNEGISMPARVRIDLRRNRDGEQIGYMLLCTVPEGMFGSESQTTDNRLLAGLNERTRMARILLDNATRVVLFIDRDLRILPEFSPVSAKILKNRELAKSDLREVLFPTMEMSEWRTISALLDGVFRETREWRLDAMMPMLPASTSLRDGKLRLAWTLIPLERANGDKWMMIVAEPDAPSADASGAGSVESGRLDMIVSILTKKQSFHDLIRDWQDFFTIGLSHMSDLSRTPRDSLYETYRSIHTFKSGFARMGMKQTSENLNRFEDNMMTLLKGEVNEGTLRQAMLGLDPEGWIRQDMNVIEQLLGREFVTRWDTVEVDRSVMDGIATEMENMSHDTECIRVTTKFREMYCIRILKELQDYSEYVTRLGREKLNMEPEFIVQGHDLILDSRMYRQLISSLVHVFNNTIGHGLEGTAERIAHGKPAQARIECLVQRRQNRLIIEIADDGRGIDTERIRDGLRSRGQLETADRCTDREILQMIFEPGFSTLLSADNLSGRGIGLFAVMHAVRQLDGRCEVQSMPGQYTRFLFDLPLNRGVGREETTETVGNRTDVSGSKMEADRLETAKMETNRRESATGGIGSEAAARGVDR